MATAAECAVEARGRYQEELFDFLRIPSVSTLERHRPDIQRAAAFVQSQMEQAGLEGIVVGYNPDHPEWHPVVYGEWLGAPGKPTILIYGHYDVQPAEPLEEWVSDPFEPTIRNGEVYARGSSDNKGQVLANLKALQVLREANGTLPVNIKFLVEGEEETNGKNVESFVRNNAGRLKADAALVSDTAMCHPDTPTICTCLRGMVYTEWTARGAERDLHSGLYGGVAPNAIFGLVELLSQCKNADGHVQIPGFYDAVLAPSQDETESWKRVPFEMEAFRRDEVRAKALTGEPEYSVFERIGARPTFEVHGVRGGFTDSGMKTVIPAVAVAKVSARLVPDQDPSKIYESMCDFAHEHAPAGITVDVTLLNHAPATLTPTDHAAVQTAVRALNGVWDTQTVFVRSGGSIPVVDAFRRYLGLPTVLIGYGLPDDGLHGPNEKFSLHNYHMGIVSSARFLEAMGEAEAA